MVVPVIGKPVATREGGVDRNISMSIIVPLRYSVATREGGVDRNFVFLPLPPVQPLSRHPRGWRG